MLRDQLHNQAGIGNVELTVSANHSVSVLLDFVERRIAGFRNYFFSTYQSGRENFITNHLINYFNSWLQEDTSGFISYRFSFQKNPSNAHSTQETDIGIFVLNPSQPSDTIFEFEAKRLSDSSNNTEYVYGERGGIERFKRNDHARHLNMSGMVGYVQSKTAPHWLEKINEWITKKASAKDEGIDWTQECEKLCHEVQIGNTEKCRSVHMRTNNEAIQLTHYFMDLTISA